MTDYLTVDLENPLSVDLFLRQIRNERTIRESFLWEHTFSRGRHSERYINEIVLPFWSTENRRDSTKAATPRRSNPRPEVEPTAEPLADLALTAPIILRIREGVLQAKVHGGEQVLDKMLRGNLGAFIRRTAQADAVKSWFFIRYTDPDFHLRLRFFGDPAYLTGTVLPALEEVCDPTIGSGIWHLQFDAYEPETQRYGGPRGVRLAEDLFGFDSSCVLDLIGITDPSDRWLVAAMSADALLSDFNLGVAGKLALLENYGESLRREFILDTDQDRAIGRLYRNSRLDIRRALGEEDGGKGDWLESSREILADRSRLMLPWVDTIQTEERAGHLTKPIRTMLCSYLHMHCNRLFASQMRRQETILLQLLIRQYKEILHRSRAGRVSARKKIEL